MPEMNGDELLQHIRQSADLKEIRVIMSSASVFDQDRQQCFDAGADAFLPKPVEVNQLFTLLQQLLQLEWIYDDSSVETPIESTPASEAIVLPDPAMLSVLYDLARKGLLNDLTQQLETLEQSNPALKSFCQPLCTWAEEFQLKKIRTFLEQYTTEAP